MALHAKQAHWNVTGPAFLPLHALTDEIAADARMWADRVAERAMALGFTVDVRPGTVAAVAGDFPAGRVSDHEAIAELVELDRRRRRDSARLARPISRQRTRSRMTSPSSLIEGLEKYRWMLRAQTL